MISTKELEGKVFVDELNHVKYIRTVCECGCSEYFLSNKPRPCRHCGRTVYPLESTKFKDKIEKIKRKKEKEL